MVIKLSCLFFHSLLHRGCQVLYNWFNGLKMELHLQARKSDFDKDIYLPRTLFLNWLFLLCSRGKNILNGNLSSENVDGAVDELRCVFEDFVKA